MSFVSDFCIQNILEKKLDEDCTKMLRAILNNSWKQHPHETTPVRPLTSHLKTIQIKRTRHAGLCCRSKDKLISDSLRWISSHGRASVDQLTRISLQQSCRDTGCSLEDLSGAMDDRDGWGERERERVREIRASNVT